MGGEKSSETDLLFWLVDSKYSKIKKVTYSALI